MSSQPHGPPPGAINADRGYVKRDGGNEGIQ
jgi:hypothetical protein